MLQPESNAGLVRAAIDALGWRASVGDLQRYIGRVFSMSDFYDERGYHHRRFGWMDAKKISQYRRVYWKMNHAGLPPRMRRTQRRDTGSAFTNSKLIVEVDNFFSAEEYFDIADQLTNAIARGQR